MRKAKKLKYGETPFDKLSPEEMKRALCRAYSAVSCLASCLRITRCADETSPFWSMRGSGGRALAKAEAVLDPVEKEFDGESIYRAYFRYADDLLFSPEVGFNWAYCPTCKQMVGPSGDKPPSWGKVCREAMPFGKCDSVLRPLEWADLKAEA